MVNTMMALSGLRKVFNLAAMGLRCLLVVAGMSLSVQLMPVAPFTPTAYAETCDSNDSNFLSFPTWYRNLNCCDGHVDLQGESIGDVVVIVALNIVDIVLRLLSIAAIGFIIYGGILYLIARGEPANVAKGKATITHAIVGLIIGIASSAIVAFASSRIGG